MMQPDSTHPIKKAALAGLILAVLTAAFFWQVLFTANTWMPAGGGDLVPFLYPNYQFAAHWLKQGVVPLWNPHLYSGLPFAADAQSGLFYPVNLLIFLLTPTLTVKTLELLAIFHFWLAGWGMFLYLQHSPLAHTLKLSPVAALAGAITFEFSDLFIVHFGNLNMIAVAAWLPLVMLAYQNAVVYRRARLAMAAGLLLAVATLAGHMQITLFMLLAMALFTLWEMIFPTDSANRWLPPVILLPAVLVMIGLSAVWLFPTLEMSRYTLRANLPYPETAAYSLHPAQLIGLLVPNYFGRDPAIHWGPWDRVETGYIGVLTLLLAIVGGWLCRHKHARFLSALAAISFLLALGDSSILHGWLSLTPGFGQFRAPARYILLLDFSLAGLAAVGLNHLMGELSPAAERDFSALLKWLTGILTALTVISLPLAYYALLVMQDRNPDIFRRAQAAATGVTTFALLLAASLMVLHLAKANRLKQTGLGLAAAALIALDLFSLGATVDVGHTDPAAGFNHPEAVAFLQQNAGINRVEVTTDVWHLWQPDSALLYGLYDAWGLYNPLTLGDSTRYWQQATPRSSAAYNLLGIKYIIAGKGGAPADGNIVPVFDADPAINIYLNLDALPRALFFTHTRTVSTTEEAWTALQNPAFDPANTVILQNAPALSTATANSAGATLGLLEYSLHTVKISVNTAAPGYLFLSDTDYPGWQATVDGQPVPIYRADALFRAVPVSAGEHLVTFEFKPLSGIIGAVVSGITLLGLAIKIKDKR